MNTWILSSFITWAPIAVLLITIFILIRYIERISKKYKNEQNNEIFIFLSFFNIKKLIILLLLTFIFSMFNSSNRPKNNANPNLNYQQQTYEEQIQISAKKAKKEIKKVESIQDSFKENREEILEQFEY